MMAKCPACRRSVSLTEVVKQSGMPTYSCVRCGRSWRFTSLTVALSGLLALIPFVLVTGKLDQDTAANVLRVAGAFALSCLVYLLIHVVFGRLEAIRNSGTDRAREQQARR
jgi:hypothetical protein